MTAVEMQGITEATNYLFANDMLSLADTALFMVVAMSGRRPAQVAALKLKDLVASGDKRFIRFPRANSAIWGGGRRLASTLLSKTLVAAQRAGASC
ncbi:hypothetical protein ULF88_07745 [Halopseudomonas pachastrellae]|nr:hypothetical protein [Halopseudomonas pachastrellae]